jgi:S-adenosylmethionine:tRNA ribosyltransferase-isomerase
MLLEDFNYHLPEELIAQVPIPERDQSRLLVLHKDNGQIEHKHFYDIIEYLEEGDLLVFNDTRVMPARLEAFKQTGGHVELLLTAKISPGVWSGMVKPGRRVAVGTKLVLRDGLTAEILSRTPEGGRIIQFNSEGDPDNEVARQGIVPLPPYIHKTLEDPERYQTVYASIEGSSAAPTAGLHFTDRLLTALRAKRVVTAFVTLHVGIATFRPVRTTHIEDHEMHSEWFSIEPECVEAVRSCRGRVIAVGTTSVRALESGAIGHRLLKSVQEETKMFITPGYEFQVVDCMITNFHIPKSTLLVLVSALAGSVDNMQKAYMEALKEQYRFLSLGDAMFIC